MEIAGLSVTLKKDPSIRGIMIREYVEQKPAIDGDTGATIIHSTPVCVVIWEKFRSPALHYHHPAELSWEGILTHADLDDDDYDEEEEDEEDENEEEEELEAEHAS